MLYSIVNIWISALRRILPGPLTLPGLAMYWQQSAAVSMRDGHLCLDTEKIAKGAFVDVRLEDSVVLSRELSLPKMARKKVPEALRLSLIQSTPDDLANLKWSFVELSKESSTYLQFVCKSEAIEGIKKRLQSRKAKLRTLAPLSHPDAIIVDNRQETDKPIYVWWCGALVVVGMIIGLLALEESRRVFSLKERIDVIRSANESTIESLNEQRSGDLAYSQRASDFAALERRVNASLGKASLLVRVTESLDDLTWIPSARFASDNVELAVISTHSPPDIIDALSTIPTVASVSSLTPAALDRRTGLSRFDLKLELAND